MIVIKLLELPQVDLCLLPTDLHYLRQLCWSCNPPPRVSAVCDPKRGLDTVQLCNFGLDFWEDGDEKKQRESIQARAMQNNRSKNADKDERF